MQNKAKETHPVFLAPHFSFRKEKVEKVKGDNEKWKTKKKCRARKPLRNAHTIVLLAPQIAVLKSSLCSKRSTP
jgi:cellobiose-specific phosphotransferase system component IIB